MRARPSISSVVAVAVGIASTFGGPPPDLTVDPVAGPPGTSVTVRGDGDPCTSDVVDAIPVRIPLRRPPAQPAEAIVVTFDSTSVTPESVEVDDEGNFTIDLDIPQDAAAGTGLVAASCGGIDLGSAEFTVEAPPPTDPEPTDDPGPDPSPSPTPAPTGVPPDPDPDPVASSTWLLIAIALVIATLLVALVMQGRRGRAWVRGHVRVVARREAVGDEVRPVRSRDPAPPPTVVVRLEARADRDQHVTLQEGR